MSTQVRTFNFFDVKKDSDGGKLLDALKDAKITSSSAGYGHILIGDSKGWAHLLTRQLDLVSFEAHSSAVNLADIHSTSNLAVTVSSSSKSNPSEIKIWLPDRQNSHGLPVCARVLLPDPRSFYENKRGQTVLCPKVTAVALHPNNSFMAVGFEDGSVMLHRGDVRRQHGTKYRLIVTLSDGSITNLQIRLWEKFTHLFVTTKSSVYCINCSTKDKETTNKLDTIGCNSGCSALTNSKQEHEFLVAKNDGIYSYTTDSRASCYAFSGNKLSLSTYKGYLIVVSEENNYEGNCSVKFTIFDPLNKLILLAVELTNIAGVVCEWGSLYVVTHEPSLIHLCEKDLQTKFDILFRKNQFDIAVNLAKMQCCDAEDISEILKQYGDWLYSKGNFSTAVNQYIKTIPHLEPSYIIRKFIEPQHISHLTTYLQSLHVKGYSNSNHKTLLLNCYTRLRDTQQLDEFIMNKDGQLDCDIELGIKVCRKAAYYDHALALASQNNLHNVYISILINDKKDFEGAIRYIQTLAFDDARLSILQYGSLLLSHCPSPMTELLVNICTNYIPSNQEPQSSDGIGKKADPEDFEYLLVGHSVGVNFLESLREVQGLSSHLNTTLLSQLLYQYSSCNPDQKKNIGDKITRILNNSENCIDLDHALLLCDKHKFYAGRMILWNQAGMFEEIVSWNADHNDFNGVLDICTKEGVKHPQLWCLALRRITAENISQEPSSKHLNVILRRIEENKLLPPMEVVDILSRSPFVTLGQVRDYLSRVVASHTTSLSLEDTTINQYKLETIKMKEEITNLTTAAREFTGTKCCVCNNNLDLPSIHFLCKHSFHMHCFESYTGSDSDCPLCLSEYKKLSEAIDIQSKNVSKPEYLREQMEKSSDCFTVMADFISKGIFSNNASLSFIHPQPSYVKVPEKESRLQVLERTNVDSACLSEGRLRLQEASTKTHEVESEGRLRTNSKHAEVSVPSEAKIRSFHSSSILKPEPRLVHTDWKPSSLHEHISPASSLLEGTTPITADTSSSISNKRSSGKLKSENPFEIVIDSQFHEENPNPFGDFETEESSSNPFEGDYDNSKNPFAEQELLGHKKNNPFDEYDETLNPFGG